MCEYYICAYYINANFEYMIAIDFFEAKVENTFSPMDYMYAIKQQPEQFILVDVRNAPPHLKKVKITNAIQIPLNELESRLAELPDDKTIIVYCWDTWCNLGAKAAIMLLKHGYKVKELSGGIAAWQTMQFQVDEIACGC